MSRNRELQPIKSLAAPTVFLTVLCMSSSAVCEKGFAPGFDGVRDALVRGEIEEALAYYESLARWAETFVEGDPYLQRRAAQAYRDASMAAHFAGYVQKSIDYGHKSLELSEKIGPGFQLRVITQLVRVYRDIGRLEKARELVEKGLRTITNLSSGSASPWLFERAASYWEGRLYSVLGTILAREGKREEAVHALSRAISVAETLPFYPSPEYDVRENRIINNYRNLFVLTLLRLGGAYQAIGSFREAIQQYRRALQAIEEWRFESLNDTNLHAAMGSVYFELEDYTKALEYLEKALELEKIRRPRSLMIASNSRKIGDVLRVAGRPGEALPYYRQTVHVVESVRSLLELDHREAYFGTSLDGHVRLIETLVEVGIEREAFDYNERARSRLFLDLLGNKVELSRAESGLGEEGKKLNERVAAIKAKLARGMHREGLERELAEAEEAYESFLAKVKGADTEQASLMAVEPLTLAEVQELLDPQSTLVEYFVTDNSVFIWTVGKDFVEHERLPVSREKLVWLVGTLRESITRLETAELNEVSAALYRVLVAPALRDVRGTRLIIVPHDVLHYLPFQALISPEGRYLIEEHSIQYLTSASLMKFTRAKRRPQRHERVLAFGDPALSNSKPKLEFARSEVRGIERLYPQATVLVDKDATEAAGKSLSPRHDILHFATHAELRSEDPLSSAVLLSAAGQEDGRLEVREIFGMDLRADLVVLSGCETGLGKLSRGDEIAGLTRAFIYAGTPSVVASLWKVEDSSTAAFMGNFYKNLKTMSKAEALRQAQLAMIRGQSGPRALAMRGVGGITTSVDGSHSPAFHPAVPRSSSHPYFWAPFVLVGDGQ